MSSSSCSSTSDVYAEEACNAPSITAQYHILRTDGTIATANHDPETGTISYRMQDGTVHHIRNIPKKAIVIQFIVPFEPSKPSTAVQRVNVDMMPEFYAQQVMPGWLYDRYIAANMPGAYYDEEGIYHQLQYNPMVSGYLGNFVLCQTNPKTGKTKPFAF